MSKFKKGDRVRNVSDKTSDVPIGGEFVVTGVDSDGDIEFIDNGGDERCWPHECYELVAAPTFKVGDEVRVVRKVEQAEGWRDVWAGGMDAWVGREFSIVGESYGGFDLGDAASTSKYNFPAAALELVAASQEASAADERLKAGDYVVVTTSGRRDVTLGKAYKVERIDSLSSDFVVIRDDVAYEHLIAADQVRRATPEEIAALNPTPTFDATKLRKGDKVLVVVDVRRDGLDSDGDVVVTRAGYVRPSDIVGYAPGYTPAVVEEGLKIGDIVEYDDSPGDLKIMRINEGRAEALLELAHVPDSTCNWYVRPLADLRRVNS